jgi:fumarate hydratase class II
MLPLIADKVLASIELLSGACTATDRAVAGFSINREQLEQTLARNPILVTALNTRIGYEAAAAIAKRAYAEQRPIIDVAAQETGIPRQELAALLDPARLAGLNPG